MLEQKQAEKVYRTLFDKNMQGQPMMTDMGKAIIPGSKIPVETLYKRTQDQFLDELKDESMAALHFTHHQKRRCKNLLRLGALIQGSSGSHDMTMPALGGKNSSMDLMASPAQAYASGTSRKAHGILAGRSGLATGP